MRCIEKVFQDFFCSMCWILFTLSDVTEFSPGAGDDALVTEAMSEAQEAEQYLLFSSQSSPLH